MKMKLLILLTVFILTCSSTRFHSDKEEDRVIESFHDNNKRALQPIILTAIHSFAIGAALYRSIAKCRLVTPSLQPNMERLTELTKEVIHKKSEANFVLGEAYSSDLYLRRLNSSIYILMQQLNDIDSILNDLDRYTLTKRSFRVYHIVLKVPTKGVGIHWNLVLRSSTVKVLAVTKIANALFDQIVYTKKCLDTQKIVNKALESVVAVYKKIEVVAAAANVFKTVTEKAYDQLFQQINSSSTLDSIREYRTKITKSKLFSEDRKKFLLESLEQFLNQYLAKNSSRLIRDRIMQNLTDHVLPKIIKNFDCVREKNRAFQKIYTTCELGSDHFESIFKAANADMMERCGNEVVLDFNITKDGVEKQLKEKGKQEVCVRNNKLKKKLACNFKDNKRNSSFIQKTLDIGYLDLLYFFTLCQYTSVPNIGISAICYEKTLSMSLSLVKSKYSNWDPEEIMEIYVQCLLNDRQKADICSSKLNGVGIDEVLVSYKTYKENDVQKVYDNCSSKSSIISPFEKIVICHLKSSLQTINSPLMNLYRNKYTSEALQEALNSC